MPPVDPRIEPAILSAYAEALAALARHTRDVSRAEDRLHDAIVEALRTWPRDGVPDRPAAWLATVGRNRSHDRHRRRQRHEAWLENRGTDQAVYLPERWGDELLGLLASVCHAELSPADRAVLALHTVLGLSTNQVATAFLSTPSAMERRITRARARLVDRARSFEVPAPDELPERLPSMLDAAHALFTEGHWSSAGAEPIRGQLCDLAESIAAGLVRCGEHTEARGLLASILMHRARLPARWRAGAPVPLPDQDRDLWDPELYAQALAILPNDPGPYALEAHIAACHMAGPADQTDWGRIDALYEALLVYRDTPVARLNHALARGYSVGAEAGLELLEPLLDHAGLARQAYVHLVRAELCSRAGRPAEALSALDRALERARNDAEAQQIASRRVDCAQERR